MKFVGTAIVAVSLFVALGPAGASESGTYTRPNGDTAQVTTTGGKMFCKIVKGEKAGFEMCHGMSRTGDGVWQGDGMKHPSMPGLMTFNGTVTMTADGLNIKGCAVGQSMCDAEHWVKAH